MIIFKISTSFLMASCYFISGYYSIDTPCYEGKQQLEYTAKTLLNTLASRRIYGQEETHNTSLNLPLKMCSEEMKEIRISGWIKIQDKLSSIKHMSSHDHLYKYCFRKENPELSLLQYFHFLQKCKVKNNKLIIPYTSGLNSLPIFPVTPEYERGSLIRHHPWSKVNFLNIECDDTALQRFQEFVGSMQCPPILKLEFQHVRNPYYRRKHYFEPTNSNIDPKYNPFPEGYDTDDEVETGNLLHVMNSFSSDMKETFTYQGMCFDKGIHYKWDTRLLENDPKLEGTSWLHKQIVSQQNKSNKFGELLLPETIGWINI